MAVIKEIKNGSGGVIRIHDDYCKNNTPEDNQKIIDVYVVWSCKTLQNSKALLSTTVPDGMYYELTYNGDKHELYLDAYKKFQNMCFKL